MQSKVSYSFPLTWRQQGWSNVVTQSEAEKLNLREEARVKQQEEWRGELTLFEDVQVYEEGSWSHLAFEVSSGDKVQLTGHSFSTGEA